MQTSFANAFVIIDGEAITDVATIFSATDTFSMFSSNRLTIVKRFSHNPKKISLEKKLVEKLQSIDYKALDLVFWEDKNLSARSYSYKKKKPTTAKSLIKKTVDSISLAKFLNDSAKVESFGNLTENELINWISSELQRLNIKNGNNFARVILDKVGGNQLLLSGELEKLALWARANNRDRLEATDLSVVTLYHQSAMIWDLTDAICNRNKPLALGLLEDMLKGPEDYPLIFSATLKQIRNIYIAKKFASEKDRLMKALGLKPYTFSKLVRFANGFTEAQIQTLYSKLVNLDYTVKQGKIEVKLGLDLLVATL